MDSENRIAHNETLFREVNERLEAGRWPTDRDEPAAYRCECGSLGCNRLVELRREEYERVRASPVRFVLVSGHEILAVERVVDRQADHVIVEKFGEAAKTAEETDPRDD